MFPCSDQRFFSKLYPKGPLQSNADRCPVVSLVPCRVTPILTLPNGRDPDELMTRNDLPEWLLSGSSTSSFIQMRNLMSHAAAPSCIRAAPVDLANGYRQSAKPRQVE